MQTRDRRRPHIAKVRSQYLSLAKSPSELGLLYIHLVGKRGELIARASPFLANPGLASRMRNDAPMKAPDMATFYRPGARGYTGDPALAP